MQATLERSGDSGTLELTGLRQLPSSEVYQAWVQRDGRMEPSSLFAPRRNGTASAAIPRHLDGAARVLVTVEPAAAAWQPTSAPLVARRRQLSSTRRARRGREITHLGCCAHGRDLLPPSRPRDRGPLLELRPADLPRLHDALAGRDALPGMLAADDQGGARGRAPSTDVGAAPATCVLIGLNVVAFLAEIATGTGGLSGAAAA